MNRYTFNEYLKKEIKNPRFKKGFEDEKQKLNLGYQIFLARESAGMTQGELARKIGTTQSNISRLEQGNYNFTVDMLERIASALRVRLRIEFIPSEFDKAA